jgi:putative transposase
VFLDIFSRKMAGWQVYTEESSQTASDMQDICLCERIAHDQVVSHSDNGSSMERIDDAGDAAKLRRCGFI